MGDPFAVGRLRRVEDLALAQGEALEAVLGAFVADKAAGQQQQVLQLHGQQGAVVGPQVAVLTNKAAGLPVLGDAGAREHRHQRKHQPVAGQGQHHAKG